jgi:hypothetical protein
VFLHLVGYGGHVLLFHASGVQNDDMLFFMPGWAQSSFHKKCTRYVELVFLHPVGSAGHIMHSGVFGA